MITYKIGSLVASFAFLSLAFTFSASADTDLRISDNGAFSDNTINARQDSNITVRQTNNTDITNNVSVSNNTGHNSANFNTGSDVDIRTGDAEANVEINNRAGSNVANVSPCGNCNNDTDIRISGNGAFSDNTILYNNQQSTTVDQDNNTDIDNTVRVDNNTGHNDASWNTGGYWRRGDVEIDTGDATANVEITNTAGQNVANVTGCSNCAGDTDITIHGNGAFSDNAVQYSQNANTRVNQDNNTDFDNDVNVENNTGYNSAGESGRYQKHYPFSDFGKKYHDYDKEYNRHDYAKDKKHYDHDSKDYDYDKVKYVPHHDYNKSYDHDKKHNPKHGYVTKAKHHYAPYVIHYPVVKKVVYHPRVIYVPVFKHYNFDHNKKDKDHEKKYSKNYDFDKKDHHGYKKDVKHDDKKYGYDKHHTRYNPYVFAKKHYGNTKYNPYHQSVKNVKHDCDCGDNRYQKTSYPHRFGDDWFPRFHGGNSGGDVTIRTGDATADVRLTNTGSSNYFTN